MGTKLTGGFPEWSAQSLTCPSVLCSPTKPGQFTPIFPTPLRSMQPLLAHTGSLENSRTFSLTFLCLPFSHQSTAHISHLYYSCCSRNNLWIMYLKTFKNCCNYSYGCILENKGKALHERLEIASMYLLFIKFLYWRIGAACTLNKGSTITDFCAKQILHSMVLLSVLWKSIPPLLNFFYFCCFFMFKCFGSSN